MGVIKWTNISVDFGHTRNIRHIIPECLSVFFNLLMDFR